MLASAPIEVGPALQEQLYKKVPTVIMTSATLSAGGRGGFRHFQQRLGLDKATTLQLGSPFNYREQAELHLFRHMPDPAALPAKFEEAVLAKIPEYVERTQGRAFVLFTSYQFLKRAAKQLRPWFEANGYPLLSQGDGVAARPNSRAFRTTPQAVLFGVDSFWQGVDVPGEALSNVIITKLPFAVPDRPLAEARQEAIDREGRQRVLRLSGAAGGHQAETGLWPADPHETDRGDRRHLRSARADEGVWEGVSGGSAGVQVVLSMGPHRMSGKVRGKRSTWRQDSDLVGQAKHKIGILCHNHLP